MKVNLVSNNIQSITTKLDKANYLHTRLDTYYIHTHTQLHSHFTLYIEIEAVNMHK